MLAGGVMNWQAWVLTIGFGTMLAGTAVAGFVTAWINNTLDDVVGLIAVTAMFLVVVLTIAYLFDAASF